MNMFHYGQSMTGVKLRSKLVFQKKIDPATTLLFFDEIQASQAAMDALKFFHDQAPQFFIVATGSFLGVVANRFPVGQVNCLTLYPLSFANFYVLRKENRWPK